jgi:Holliday junction DNA helicase RuvA
MIGRLEGRCLEAGANGLLLDVNGVGYEVACPERTASECATQDVSVLMVHQVVREDAQLLFGFATKLERDLFRNLIRVTGVGPKLALAVLSRLDPPALIQAVRHEDVKALQQVPGIGKKTAERLLLEVSDRLSDFIDVSSGTTVSNPSAAGSGSDDALEALLALGFSRKEATGALARIAGESHKDSAGQIRAALGYLRGRVTHV